MKVKHIYLALAVLFLLIISLYIGGLLSQVLDNYQAWNQAGGMAGEKSIAPTVFKADYCLKVAFTGKGLMRSTLILTIIAGVILFFILKGRMQGDEDGRNFKRSKKGTYGTADWMKPKEMNAVLDCSRIADTSETILGKRNGKVLTISKRSRLNKNVLIVGSTGSGKSVCYVRPFALQCIRRGESIILTDPKSEIYEDLAGIFIDNGYEVKVFNTIDPSHSDSWNCMDYINGDELAAQTLSSIIMNNTMDDKRQDTFWNDNETNLLKALVLYIDDRKDGERSLAALYQMLTNSNARRLVQIFEGLPTSHPARAPASYFIKAEPTVQTGTINGLGIRLQVLQSKAVKSITSRSDIDLSQPGKRKCAYFVLLSDQDSAMNFLTSLFFRFLFNRLVRYADNRESGRCRVPVNVCLEEFCNIGTLGVDFARQLNTIRSRGISVSMIVQSLPQLKNRYLNDLWQEIIGACDTQLLLGCTENDTADHFSVRSGEMTVEVESTMVQKQTLAVAQVVPQYRESSGVGKRKLMTVDELMRMDNSKQLIAIRGQNVLLADKYFYKEHPLAKLLRKVRIKDYWPVDGSPIDEDTELDVLPDSNEQPRLFKKIIRPDDF